ncbi:MAG: DUF983 domain-containing protein [Bacteroidota bacterium]
MINKGDKVYSIFNNKCPRCHKGDFFVNKSSFNFKGFSKMNEKCEKCELSFEQEPGYYFGAMYISYAINVAIMVSVWVAFLVLAGSDFNVWWMIAVSIVLGLALTPMTFRISRLAWINFFVKFRGLENG